MKLKHFSLRKNIITCQPQSAIKLYTLVGTIYFSIMHVAMSVLIGNLSWVIESDSCFLTFQQNQISDIIPAILSAEVVIAASNDWRLQETIIDHFKCFQHLTNSETIYQKILPVLLNKLRRAVSVFVCALSQVCKAGHVKDSIFALVMICLFLNHDINVLLQMILISLSIVVLPA